MVISDPELAGQILDRSRTPHQIDKPHEPMFYHAVDEVMCLDSSAAAFLRRSLRVHVPSKQSGPVRASVLGGWMRCAVLSPGC